MIDTPQDPEVTVEAATPEEPPISLPNEPVEVHPDDAPVVEPEPTAEEIALEPAPEIEAPVVPEGLAWEPWSPDGHAQFQRLSESNFDEATEWVLGVVIGEHGTPKHSVYRRPLKDGRIAARPNSYLESDYTEEQ